MAPPRPSYVDLRRPGGDHFSQGGIQGQHWNSRQKHKQAACLGHTLSREYKRLWHLDASLRYPQ